MLRAGEKSWQYPELLSTKQAMIIGGVSLTELGHGLGCIGEHCAGFAEMQRNVACSMNNGLETGAGALG